MSYSHPRHVAPRARWVLPGTVWWGNLTGCAGSVVAEGRFVGSCMQLCTQVCLWHSPGVPPAHAHFLAKRRPRNTFITVQGLSPNHSSFRTSCCCCMLSWASSCWLFTPHPPVLEVPHHTSPQESQRLVTPRWGLWLGSLAVPPGTPGCGQHSPYSQWLFEAARADPPWDQAKTSANARKGAGDPY